MKTNSQKCTLWITLTLGLGWAGLGSVVSAALEIFHCFLSKHQFHFRKCLIFLTKETAVSGKYLIALI
jgi:hypothetical protein